MAAGVSLADFASSMRGHVRLRCGPRVAHRRVTHVRPLPVGAQLPAGKCDHIDDLVKKLLQRGQFRLTNRGFVQAVCRSLHARILTTIFVAAMYTLAPHDVAHV